MNRRLTAIVGIAALVALAGCAGFAGTATPTDGDEAQLERNIEVTATGEATSAPDRATLRVAVTATGSDAAAVRDELAAGEEDLRAALTEWGLSDDAIRTERYDVQESYETRDDPNRTRYQGVHQYAIELDDVGAVAEVIDVAIDAGADEVQRIEFGLSEETEREVREEAIAQAMSNADADAAALADASGLEVSGVYEVSTGRSQSRPYVAQTYESAAGGDAGAATAVESGDVSVSVSVNVVYEAAPA
ncbi:SIMPL domain-containing protein [Halorubrum ezzemoulense]|uniref:SIMPL domain-containing protein n=1 Tax=Halorubrum ezzemoulense TaxID=337243 RepID=UPI00232EEF55|nr:SIMPL domain-containing protein [Halorubrum ezzemoulense]MDB2270429.1 SIMPL domain-containing protein [Halorubrum ezzemoulense]